MRIKFNENYVNNKLWKTLFKYARIESLYESSKDYRDRSF